MLIAHGARLFPSFLNRYEAITEVLPVYSSNKPKVVPKTIIRPRDFSVLPKPSLITARTSPKGNLIPRPTNKHARNSAKKAGTLNLVVNNTIRPIPAIKKVSIYSKEWAIFKGLRLVRTANYKQGTKRQLSSGYN